MTILEIWTAILAIEAATVAGFGFAQRVQL